MDKQATPKRLDSKSQVRDYLFKALKRDLVGPSWKEGTTEENPVEVLNLQRNSPYTYYFCGYISPAKAEESKPVDNEIQNKDVDLLNSKEEELPPEKFNGESANSSEEDLRHINSSFIWKFILSKVYWINSKAIRFIWSPDTSQSNMGSVWPCGQRWRYANMGSQPSRV